MKQPGEFDSFVETIKALRAPDGCPWDKEQTHESIAHNMIEEAYEAVDAIESGDAAHLREELGDVLLQVVLQSQIAADAGEFTIDDVCSDINAKIIRRHPHVFGELHAEDASEVSALWESVKLAEQQVAAHDARTPDADTPSGGNASAPVAQGLLNGVPKGLPACIQAYKISKKAAAAGFEWNDVDAVWKKVFEEIDELKEAYAQAPKDSGGRVEPKDADAVEMEFGDVLFSLVNVGRKMGVDAESSLRASCMKFRRRWAHVEGAAAREGCLVEHVPMDDLQALWERAKRVES